MSKEDLYTLILLKNIISFPKIQVFLEFHIFSYNERASKKLFLDICEVSVLKT